MVNSTLAIGRQTIESTAPEGGKYIDAAILLKKVEISGYKHGPGKYLQIH